MIRNKLKCNHLFSKLVRVYIIPYRKMFSFFNVSCSLTLASAVPLIKIFNLFTIFADMPNTLYSWESRLTASIC